MQFDFNILNLNSPVIFFPVRHHSPTCARLVKQLALEIQPAAILIEGPFDFNSQISELFLPHKLPIAIYSYTRLNDGSRRGAFYPLCIYSPEWQALQIANELNIPVRFIDLPWAEIAETSPSSHRYADPELRRSNYVAMLCEQLGVEGLDDLWDLLFEIEPELSLTQYLERCHQFCFHSRVSNSYSIAKDLQREDFMVEQIQQAIATYSGQILVVTGGFHSYALYAKLYNLPFVESDSETDKMPISQLSHTPNFQDRGIALTPFAYARLDGLTGYDAGMPSPGFYHQVWCDRLVGKTDTYRQLLTQIVRDLRQENQVFSSADVIAVETTAKGLAALRSHQVVWRQDLIDGITASLIKEALDRDRLHPFLVAVYDILRGNARGELAEGTSLPPLVQNIKQLLQKFDLAPQSQERIIDLNLHEVAGLKRSQILHQLRILEIAGYTRTAGSDLVTRDDLANIWEEWTISWSPYYEASCIENAIYGTTLIEAAQAKLLELAAQNERNAERAALLLLDTYLMGSELTPSLYQELRKLIDSDGDFFSVTGALTHLLYLYRYDEVLKVPDRTEIGQLLSHGFSRGLWLLEILGQVKGRDRELLLGVKILLETLERCGRSQNLNQTEFTHILQRVSTDTNNPLLRGAAAGVLWTLNAASEQIFLNLRACAEPNQMGDFLTGLFCLAREVVQRYPDLLLSIDEFIISFDEETFLAALPALHLAFTYFTPREKHAIASTLVKAWGNNEAKTEPLLLAITPEISTQVEAFERKLIQIVERYGLRGGKQ